MFINNNKVLDNSVKLGEFLKVTKGKSSLLKVLVALILKEAGLKYNESKNLYVVSKELMKRYHDVSFINRINFLFNQINYLVKTSSQRFIKVQEKTLDQLLLGLLFLIRENKCLNVLKPCIHIVKNLLKHVSYENIPLTSKILFEEQVRSEIDFAYRSIMKNKISDYNLRKL